ncbi:hypothetical protein BDW02DRAFT_342654 [Decorospora gaudefroyi]|uniref:Uncharacterized protein n=1 Tax=Decorospora gaudefroyi TaxID=184978 RepID=A0A6A5KD95_9PLEO|nr:hypothetical protein BDW02DRAFT_342654 [Decorospora gaudefroyi]
MAKPKTLVISGPMDAKHVSGVNVMGNSGPNLDNYFPSAVLVPDELPSHTFVAVGKTEVPRRSETISSTIRRPSVSLKRSLSRLRNKSISHHSEPHRQGEDEHENVKSVLRSESANSHRPLRMQSSLSRLRQRVGLDRELYDSMPASKAITPEPEIVPEPIQKDYPPLQDRKAIARLTTASSIYTTYSTSEPVSMSIVPQRKPSLIRQRSTSAHRSPSPVHRQPSNAKKQPAQPPTRPKRTDSGTAIDFSNVPVQERPIPFKEIMAVSSFDERMAMYKKSREYWASADHGLTTWTERAMRAKPIGTRS